MSQVAAPPTIALTNADIAGFGRGCLRISGPRIASLGEGARPGDQVIDLRGDRLLPGLINAHDHLHRNHYPPLKFRERYEDAGQWAADIDARRDTDAMLTACALVPRADRLLIGAIKNLLSGATTVVHHDAPFPELASPAFPVHVPSNYTWAHSLAIDGAQRVRESHHAAPAGTPWFIHAGEGTSAAAAQEAAQLDALGCITANSFLVHGIAFDAQQRASLSAAGAKLVWCPTSNLFLFGATAQVSDLMARACVLLGTDSRLSGGGGMLEELRVARAYSSASDAELEVMVTSNAARLLRLEDRGVLRSGALADLLVVPHGRRLHSLARSELHCVLRGGVMLVGKAAYAERLMAAERRVRVSIDGIEMVLDGDLAHIARRLPLPGVRLQVDGTRATAA